MELTQYVESVIGQPASDTLEYNATLPPSKYIAQAIASFANTNGGALILGVSEIGEFRIVGLSEEFRATAIAHKATDMLKPAPVIHFGYVEINNRNLFVIHVGKSEYPIFVEDKHYVRKGSKIVLLNPIQQVFEKSGYKRISEINSYLDKLLSLSTNSKIKVLEHYQAILKITDDLKEVLYPESPNVISDKMEGRILTRILYSSFVDNFETYLSDILFEICLAKPETLKSKENVEIEEVLKCADIQEFITYWAKKKIAKLQRGSVKGFIEENKQIRDLKVLDKEKQNEIEKILQIRHLYCHRNGIIDEKFRSYFNSAAIGEEHKMTIEETITFLLYLLDVIDLIDKNAIEKYDLSSI